MVRIAWRMLWQRPASMAATMVALWFAVFVVTACGAMLESGVRYHGTPQRYAAAPILVASTDLRVTEGAGDDRSVESSPLAEPGLVDTGLRDRIAALPGVRAAVADDGVPAQLLAADPAGAGAVTPVEVHPWSSAQLAPFTLRAGSAPAGDAEVVLDQRLAAQLGAGPGTRVRLDLPGGVDAFTVTGIAAPTGAAPGTATVFLDDARAAAVAGHPGSTRVIAVLPEPGIDAHALARTVRAALPAEPERLAGAYPRVFVGVARGSVESPAVDNGREFVIAVSGVFGGNTLVMAILVIAGTVGLSVRQRHRDIALLRAIAATPRQVRRMVVLEAAALGLLAAATGIWPGLAGAQWLRDQFVSRGMVPETFRTHLSWLPPLVAAAAGLLVAVTAAWIASLRASRIPPTAALAETAVERRGVGVLRTLLGLLALAGGVTLCFVAASVGGDAAAAVSVATVFTLVVAVAMLSPLLIRVTAATLGRLLALSGVTGRLAIANTAASARQLAAVVSSLVLAVALGGSLWFVQTSQEHVAAAQSRAGVRADQVLTGGAAGISPGAVAAIRDTPGVLAATGAVHGRLFARQSGVTDYGAQGIDPAGLPQTLDLGVTAGNLADLHGDTVALDTLTAQALHLGVGGQFTGWYGDGVPVRLRVVAIYRRGLGFAPVTLPHDLLAAHTASGRDDTLFIATAVDRPDVVAALRQQTDRLAPGSTLLAADTFQVAVSEQLVQNAWTNRVITVVLLVYVVIAAVNTLVMTALARRREFAVLRLAGTTRPQVRRMVRWEQAFILGLALVLGAAIAAATLLPMVTGITGAATPYIPLSGWVSVIGGTVLLGAVSTAVPVRRVLRLRPVEAIGIRE